MYNNIRAAVVGSINKDLILNMEQVPHVGENLLGTTYSYANGGKGANQATALSRLGARVKMIGKVAEDENGKTLLENLHNEGIDTSCVATDGSSTGLAVIILDGEGKNRIIVYEGANAEIQSSDAVKSIETNPLDLLLVQFETNEEVVINSVNAAISKIGKVNRVI